jgi:uncharacterized membrane protein
MNTFIKKESLSLLVMATTIGMLAYFYPNLPDQIPVHFNINGEVDQYGSKDGFLAIFPGIMVVAYLVLFFINRIDPKKNISSPYEKPLPKIRFVMNLMFLMIQSIIIYSVTTGNMNPKFIVAGIVSIIFVGIGNLMHSMKPNYFIGFRTPWTLESEEVWVKTHRLVSKIWVTTGLINLSVIWFVSNSFMVGLTVGMLMTGIIWPFAYSWAEFKKLKKV